MRHLWSLLSGLAVPGRHRCARPETVDALVDNGPVGADDGPAEPLRVQPS